MGTKGEFPIYQALALGPLQALSHLLLTTPEADSNVIHILWGCWDKETEAQGTKPLTLEVKCSHAYFHMHLLCLFQAEPEEDLGYNGAAAREPAFQKATFKKKIGAEPKDENQHSLRRRERHLGAEKPWTKALKVKDSKEQ